MIFNVKFFFLCPEKTIIMFFLFLKVCNKTRTIMFRANISGKIVFFRPDPSDQKPVNYLLVSVAENKKYQFFLSRAIRRWNFKGGKH